MDHYNNILMGHYNNILMGHYFASICLSKGMLDWLQSLKQFFINVLYHILVASLTPMALF